MAKEKRSFLTEVAVELAEMVKSDIKYFKDNPQQPFMLEQVGKGEARKRLTDMTPEQKAEVLRQVGFAGVRELLAKEKRGAP